jgi:multimeric flavodoxin WrbA
MDDAKYLNLFRAEDIKVKLFAINASPRAPRMSRSQILLNDAKEGAAAVGGVEFLEFSFANKKIAPCRMCISYCSKHEECTVKDDFQEFRQKWLEADGIIWSTPVYHMGPPAQVRAALDRMNELRFQTSRAHGQKQYPRLTKAVGAVVQGGSRYGGQEITLQFFMHHALLLQCIPVTADMPESYLGVATQTRSTEGLLADEEARRLSRSLGRRVAEMAKVLKAGKLLLQDSLPDEYFPSLEKMGLIERRRIE